jgi:hypothetical protein
MADEVYDFGSHKIGARNVFLEIENEIDMPILIELSKRLDATNWLISPKIAPQAS